MSTLLMRLAGPMQSWGTQSRFTVRDTGMEPSKSGVVGLLCAALGRPRSEPVDDLAALRMGVRTDKEGTIRMDYHTAGGSCRKDEKYGVIKADGKSSGTVISHRYYLADADFLVGMEGDLSLLQSLHEALAAPVWQLALGRKAFVPGLPVHIKNGLLPDKCLEDALKWGWPEWQPERLRLTLETSRILGEDVRNDQPVGAAFKTRTFKNRFVTTKFAYPDSESPMIGVEPEEGG
jgi:CRISPR system Cascade subunit CasD